MLASALKVGLAGLGLSAVVAMGIWTGTFDGAESAAAEFRTVTIRRGPIAEFVSASGKLQAAISVEVGTQVSGMIRTVDVDFNSEVSAGEVIAQVDPAPFEAALHQAEAELAVARANVVVQKASLLELAAELTGQQSAAKQADDELSRKRELLKRKVETASVVDAAQSRYEQTRSVLEATRARIAKQEAQVEIALAQVQQRAAAVEQRRLELAQTFIRAPVDGIVVSRNVDPGQTVAASLQSPVLFTIAGDLTRLQVAISVDEADIGVVKVGQRVVFVVDAYPGHRFSGQVEQIRKASREISNVVTYTVIASTENAAGRLLPGMTATVSIVTAEREDVLLVANAARRLQLPANLGGHPGLSDWVWALRDDGSVEALLVTFGISDGNETEIVGSELTAGQKVVTGLMPAAPTESRNWLRLGF